MFADVDVFGARFDAEGGFFPDAEFDAGFEPCDAEAVACVVDGGHVGDEEFDDEKVVDLTLGEGAEAVVTTLGLFHEKEVHVLFGGDGVDDVVSLARFPVEDAVAAQEFRDFVEEHAGGGFGAFGHEVRWNELEGAF